MQLNRGKLSLSSVPISWWLIVIRALVAVVLLMYDFSFEEPPLWISYAPGQGRRQKNLQGEATEKSPKNSTIERLPRGGEQRKKDRKVAKNTEK